MFYVFKKKKKTLLFILLLVLLYSIRLSDRKTISRVEAISDFKYLVTNIDENFPGTYHIDETKKKRLDESYKKTIKDISSKNEIELYSFYEIINKYLSNYNSKNGALGHLYLLSSENIEHLKKLEYLFPKYSLNNALDEKVFKTYKYIYKKNKILSIDFFKGPKEINDNFEIKETANFILINIKSFDHLLKEKDLKIMKDFINENNCKKNVIIDISNCIGGSDYYWIDNFIKPNMYPNNKLFFKKDRALFLDGKFIVPYLEFFKNSSNYIVEAVNESNLEDNDRLKNFKYIVETTNSDCVFNETYNDKLFKGKIYVFYGENTSSAAEGFLEFLRHNKMALLCGSNSKGNSPFVEPLYMKLPNSNFVVRFQVDYRVDEFNEPLWESGVKPDLYFDNISELMDFIKKEDNKC